MMPPTPQEICVGLLKCPPRPLQLVWIVPLRRPVNRARLLSADMDARHSPDACSFLQLRYQWLGDRWKYAGYDARR